MTGRTLDHILGKREKLTRGHHPAMPYAEVPGFMARLREVDGGGARALELLTLTATRTGEVLGATWGEVDLDAAVWHIPGERMKAGKPHDVPLTPRALEILRAQHATRLSDYVFPGGRSPRKPLSNMAMISVLRRMKLGRYTPHGQRSSFRDWCGDATNFPRDLAEMALAHKVGDEVELAYRRGTALARRRKLMEAWERYCTTTKGSGNVVAMKVGAV